MSSNLVILSSVALSLFVSAANANVLSVESQLKPDLVHAIAEIRTTPIPTTGAEHLLVERAFKAARLAAADRTWGGPNHLSVPTKTVVAAADRTW